MGFVNDNPLSFHFRNNRVAQCQMYCTCHPTRNILKKKRDYFLQKHDIWKLGIFKKRRQYPKISGHLLALSIQAILWGSVQFWQWNLRPVTGMQWWTLQISIAAWHCQLVLTRPCIAVVLSVNTATNGRNTLYFAELLPLSCHGIRCLPRSAWSYM